ncbi:MAG: hypothetical protein DCC57_16090 [Chloroflexi bacterium]|nr:MAG: hypothetical protein DCC57_16090 [Chloroflexota bacterium]
MQQILQYDEAPLEELPTRGFSADYVARETRRTIAGVGEGVKVYPGIDVDIPTDAEHTKCTRAGVRDATLAAFAAGADGVVISRKYSEMRLDNLSGVGDAMRSL